MEALACYLRIVSETAVGETGTKCLLSLEYTLLNTFRIAACYFVVTIYNDFSTIQYFRYVVYVGTYRRVGFLQYHI